VDPEPIREADRVLILAPMGRDAMIATSILNEIGAPSVVCGDLTAFCRALRAGAAAAVVAEEALQGGLSEVVDWLGAQPAWSDFPFILLSLRGGGLERNPNAGRLMKALGNVNFLERPFHPTTLVSVVQTALRGRRRQYEARERIEDIRQAEALLERRVQERTAELASTNRQLAAQIAERERVESALRQSQRLEAVGQLTSGVAHDFNNLLTVVLGNVRQLQKTETDSSALRRLDMMAQASERAAKLTAQMLAFSRQQKLDPRSVDLNETVSAMRDLLQSTLGGSIQVQTRFEPDLWPAMIDPTQIELVILNLAINARDAMEGGGGALTIETRNITLAAPTQPEEPAAGDYVMLSVRDTGSGMAEDVRAKAFEPFFTTKAVGKGSGLGLSQVFGLAKQSGGGISIDTRLGEGTTVSLYLPRGKAVVDAVSNAPKRGIDRRPKNDVILIVDDDHLVREVTVGLVRDLGYNVLEAGSGGAALDTLDSHAEVRLVLLDFAMPGMNGAEVAREIRLRRPELPVLFATGYADAALTESDDDQIIQKPFAEADLADRLARRLAG
jgi:signal transduction histidine kinase/CheY-like chemotaxis protein